MLIRSLSEGGGLVAQTVYAPIVTSSVDKAAILW